MVEQRDVRPAHESTTASSSSSSCRPRHSHPSSSSRYESSSSHTASHGPSSRETSRHESSRREFPSVAHGSSGREPPSHIPSRDEASITSHGSHNSSRREPSSIPRVISSRREPSGASNASQNSSRQEQPHRPQTSSQQPTSARRPLATSIEATAVHDTSRINTARAPLGDMQRTYVEGLILPTVLESHHPSSTSRNQSLSVRDTPGHTQTTSHQAHRTTTNQTAAIVIEATQARPHTSRVTTDRAQLGDMQRTYVEGMRPPTALESHLPSTTAPSRRTQPTSTSTSTPRTKLPGLVPASQYDQDKEGRSYPALTALVSRPPSNARSIFTNPEDQVMATRQTRISSMAPEERNRQENWAQSIIQRAGVCPQGFAWKRAEGGYHCEGKHHFITDELLAQGRGGVHVMPGGKRGKMEPRWGPYYPDPNGGSSGGGRLVFGGNRRDNHPEWMELQHGLMHWPNVWKLVPGLRGMPRTSEDKEALDDKIGEIWGNLLKGIVRTNGDGTIGVGRRLVAEVDSDSDGSDGSNGSHFVGTVNGQPITIRTSGNLVVHTVNGRPVNGGAVFSDRGMADSRFQPGASYSGSRPHTYRY